MSKLKIILKASIVLAMVLTFSCSNVQSTNNEKLIVGTWVDEASGDTLIFNPDGTGKKQGELKNFRLIAASDNFKYAAISDKLALVAESVYVCDLFISSDGKTLIIDSRGYDVLLLRKKN
jgi:hypothetical protein